MNCYVVLNQKKVPKYRTYSSIGFIAIANKFFRLTKQVEAIAQEQMLHCFRFLSLLEDRTTNLFKKKNIVAFAIFFNQPSNNWISAGITWQSRG